MTSAATIDENVIKLTSETLGKVIKQVPLTEKLLSRPPFKFLHDIIKEIIRNNGFLSGLYTDDELSAENIKNKEDKIKFLQKTIDALSFVTNKPLDQIKASKIAAGLEPEHTNELLQLLGKCVISRKESSRAVQRVLKGEKPPSTSNANLTVTGDLLNEGNQKTKSESPRSPAKSPVRSPVRSPSKSTAKPTVKSPVKSQQTLKATKPTSQSKPSTNRPTNSTTNQAASKTTAKTTTKPTTNTVIKKTTSNLSTKSTTQRTKPSTTTTNKSSTVAKSTAQSKIGKPVTKPSTTKSVVNKSVKQTNRDVAENSIPKNRTLTKEELNAIQKAKANAEQNEEVKRLENEETNTINESDSLEMTNQKAISKTIADNHIEIEKNVENVDSLEKEDENADDAEQSVIEKSTNGERNNQRQSAVPKKQKSAKSIYNDANEERISKNITENNEISRSVKRPIVSSMQIDKQNNQRINDKPIEETKPIQRPTTASRPLTARNAPPRVVSRRALREEANNTLEQASSTRPQTSVKQVLVTNLIKESNDQLDDDDLESDDDVIDKRSLTTASRENALLKDNIIRKMEEQNDFMLGNKNLSVEQEDDPDKGSLVKKLIKSKMDLEGAEENQAKVSSATFVKSNRDIERLKEHIQTLTKLANPLSKLLDNLQEDIDLMLLEERNWLEEQNRNEQQLLNLREQMDEELKDLNAQISNLDDQIQQEKDAMLVTNVNLLTNQAKLEDIVTRMTEN